MHCQSCLSKLRLKFADWWSSICASYCWATLSVSRVQFLANYIFRVVLARVGCSIMPGSGRALPRGLFCVCKGSDSNVNDENFECICFHVQLCLTVSQLQGARSSLTLAREPLKQHFVVSATIHSRLKWCLSSSISHFLGEFACLLNKEVTAHNVRVKARGASVADSSKIDTLIIV